MQVLIVGNGGREHALAWKCAASPQVEKIYVAPGNAGTALMPCVENIDIAVTDIAALCHFAKTNNIDLTIVGPEAPLVLGIADAFESAGLACFAPSKRAAELEGSKAFAKDFLKRHDIPTAAYSVHHHIDTALAALKTATFPLVLKADGLAAGKGVVIAIDRKEAEETLHAFMQNAEHGEAGRRVVIEQFLEGEEASFIVMVDGDTVIPMATSQDHKRRYDQDLGPNTGGMGAYSPAPVVTPAMHQRIMQEVILPTIKGLKEDGIRYRGFLYAGIMITDDQTPYVLEFNCRFGDPETQPIMMRLKSDLVTLCYKATQGKLDECRIEWDPRPALGVVMVADGYPGTYVRNEQFHLPPISSDRDLQIFHAGTQLINDKIVTSGGRVLCVTALGEDIKTAQQQAYALVEKIDWPNGQYRSDIGYRAISK